MKRWLMVIRRCFTTATIIPVFILCAWTARIFSRDPQARLATGKQMAAFFARLLLIGYGFRITVSGHKPIQERLGPSLFLCNHLGYLDPIVLLSIFPSTFVTSTEVENTPFLGTMCRLGGCLFVERRTRITIRNQIDSVSKVLLGGNDVLIFPEGTSSSGDGVLPFKSGLLDSAIQCGIPITPVCIRYSRIDGRTVTVENRDKLNYYADMRFFPHFMQLHLLHRVEMEVEFLPAIDSIEVSSRKILAEESHRRISQAYVPNRTLSDGSTTCILTKTKHSSNTPLTMQS